MKIKILNFFLSKSVLKNAAVLAVVILALYLSFNYYVYSLIHFYLDKNLDFKIGHEIDHITYAFKIDKDSLIVKEISEFNEKDLVGISNDPYFLQIYNYQGKILLQSKNIKEFGAIALSFPKFNNQSYYTDTYSNNVSLRTGYKKIYDQSGELVALLQLSALNSAFDEILKNIIYSNLITFPIVLVIIIVLSVIISKKTFSPITKIIKLANEISTTNLGQRLNYKADKEDELGILRDTLNNLFTRLEMQIKNISSFTDNASHQLMTPLTALKTELEYLSNDAISSDRFSQSLTMLRDQTERMINIIQSLLILAKAEKDTLQQKSVFNLSKLIEDKVKNSYNGKNIEYNIESEIYIRGKLEYFQHVINNLIDNAIKYSLENELIKVYVSKSAGNISIEVIDMGIGIPNADKEKIFERFYRTEGAERLGIKGYGLGLSLVKIIIELFGGTIFVKDNIPKGTIFIITLPAIDIT